MNVYERYCCLYVSKIPYRTHSHKTQYFEKGQHKEKMEMGTGSVKTNSKQNYEIEILVHDNMDHINSNMGFLCDCCKCYKINEVSKF